VEHVAAHQELRQHLDIVDFVVGATLLHLLLERICRLLLDLGVEFGFSSAAS
jgi:hypothetical protein